MIKISIRNIRKSFGENVAVDIDSFDINAGDILGLVGNNGAGKTTLFRQMLDLLQADEGTVEMSELPGEDGSAAPAAINPAKSEDWKQFTGAYIDDGFLIEFRTPEGIAGDRAVLSQTPAPGDLERGLQRRRARSGQISRGLKGS